LEIIASLQYIPFTPMPSSPSASRTGAYIALIVTAALWGSNGVVSRALMDVLPPVLMGMGRWAVVFLLLLPVVWPERRAIVASIGRDWKTLVPMALLGSAPQSALVYVGLSQSTAVNLGLLNSATPVLIILISWGWYARRPRPLELFGLVLSLCGVLLILARGEMRALLQLAFNPGDLLMLCAVVTWAVYTLRLKDRPRSLSLFAFMFTLSLLGLVMALPLVAIEWVHTGAVAPGMREWLGLLYIGALPTLAAGLLYSHGVEHVGAVRAGILIHLMPVFSSFFAVSFIGEQLHLYHAGGFVLVAGGAILGCIKAEPVLSSRPSA
jgi:drug/metabolite transporter (DMT)-like permease